MIYCARLAGVQAELRESRKGHHGTLILVLMCVWGRGGGGGGKGTISALKPDGAGRYTLSRQSSKLIILFSALNTQPQPQAEGGHERTKE